MSRTMIAMVRDRCIEEIATDLKGKNVLIWTCNTCARMCDGLGGDVSAGKVSAYLTDNGVNVVGTMSVTASCVEKALIKIEDDVPDHDIILSLTCDTGAFLAGKVFGHRVLNPVRVLGHGYYSADRVPMVMTDDGPQPVSTVAGSKGLPHGPLL